MAMLNFQNVESGAKGGKPPPDPRADKPPENPKNLIAIHG